MIACVQHGSNERPLNLLILRKYEVNPPTSNPTRLAIYFQQLWTIRALATWHWNWGLYSSPRQPSSADEFISTIDANKPLMWTCSLIWMRFFRQGEVPLTNCMVVCRWFQAQVHVGRAETARTAVTKAFHEELVNGCLGDRSGAICSNQSAESNARRTSSAQKCGASTGSGKGSCHRHNAGRPGPWAFQVLGERKHWFVVSFKQKVLLFLNIDVSVFVLPKTLSQIISINLMAVIFPHVAVKFIAQATNCQNGTATHCPFGHDHLLCDTMVHCSLESLRNSSNVIGRYLTPRLQDVDLYDHLKLFF